MSIVAAMGAYAMTDKERFPSYNGTDDSVRPGTTFWADFCVADAYGSNAVRDTFKRAFNEWQNDYKYFTELTMVLNHKLWYYYETGNLELSALYDAFWKLADQYACDFFKDEAAKYYYTVTD